MNQNLFRSAVAFVPQSTVGEMLQLAIQRIHTELDYFEPLLNVHDEVVGQCAPEDLPRAIKDVRRAMTIPLEINGRELVIPCDFKTGPNWGEMKEVEE
jgi:DNA polymerase I-like protein with 3'-5' exonuclease and polymerase domains